MTYGVEHADSGRPHVVVSAGISIDGRVTLGRHRLMMDADVSHIMRSIAPESAQVLEATRSSLFDLLYHPRVVLEGSGSFVIDSAGPLVGLPTPIDKTTEHFYTDFLPEEVLERADHANWFAVVDSRGRVRWTTKGGEGGWDLLVLVARATPVDYLAFLRHERIAYLMVGEARVDLPFAVRHIQDRLGIRWVVSKAGGGLNGALLRAGLVDEIHLIISPIAIGGLGTPTVFDGPELTDGELPTRLRLLSTRAESDGMLWLRYQVIHEEKDHRAEVLSNPQDR